MQITQQDLNSASNAGIITQIQAKNLWAFWQQQQQDVPQFRFTHMLYYLGGLLAIAAATIFVTNAWEKVRGLPMVIGATLLFIGGIFLSRHFLKKHLRIPAGISAVFSLALVPLAIYNLQIILNYLPIEKDYAYTGFHYWISWYWVPMEIVTLFVGVMLFYFLRFVFLLFPISIACWYLSMDLYSLLFVVDDMTTRAAFTLYFGLIIIAAAIYMDFKYGNNRKDYAFWLYIVGVITFWGGLTMQESDSEISKFIYCMINLLMVLVSVFLNRRVFAVFGALGILAYLGHLASAIFRDSLTFPLALIALGLLLIIAATQWHKAENKLLRWFKLYIPAKIAKRIYLE